MDTGMLPIFGKMTKIDLEVEKFDLSNHAGKSDLIQFALDCKPAHLVLFHTPDDDVDEFVRSFGETPPFQILIPENGKDMVIDTDA